MTSPQRHNRSRRFSRRLEAEQTLQLLGKGANQAKTQSIGPSLRREADSVVSDSHDERAEWLDSDVDLDLTRAAIRECMLTSIRHRFVDQQCDRNRPLARQRDVIDLESYSYLTRCAQDALAGSIDDGLQER